MTDLPQSLVDALADRYRIEREIGQGGMATVYVAHDLRHDRKVAIKLLRPELAAVIGADRFLAEIRTTANLQHPHILPLHDSGTAGSSVFYVMPFIEGEALRDRLNREKQLSIPESVRIVTQVAQALDYAHRHGVIHRDIKPENILLHDGSALVADFGIALAATSAGTRMTETGMSLGTPSYMSPEQAMGERALDARTDVYALGCVLYELLVGEPPFVGPTAQAIVTKVVTERPTPPSRARDTVNEALDDVVLRALSKVPADRYATAAEFSAALSASIEPGATSSGARRKAEGAANSGARHGVRNFVAGLAVGAIAAAALWFATARGGATTSAEYRVQLSFDGQSEQPAISHDGKFVAYVQSPCEDIGVPECKYALLLREEGNDRSVTLVDSLQRIGFLRWSPDGTRLLFAGIIDSTRAGIYSVPRLGGSVKLITTRVGPFDVHARADSISVLDRGTVHIVATETGVESDSVVLDSSKLFVGIAWSPDAKHFAISSNYSALHIYTRSGELRDSVKSAFRPQAVWTPDGRALLTFVAREGKEDDLLRYAISSDGTFSGEPQVLMSKVPAVLQSDFSLSRETGRLALRMGSMNMDLWSFDLGNPQSVRRLTSGTAWYGGPALSPDGTRAWYMRGDGLGDNLYSVAMGGREEAQSAQRWPAGVLLPAVALDGGRVIFSNANPEGARVREKLLSSGAERSAAEWPDAESGILAAVGARGIAYVSSSYNAIYVADSISAMPRRVPIAAGKQVLQVASGPSEREVMALVTATDVVGGMEIGALRLADGVFSPRMRVPADVRLVSWRADGSLWYRMREPGSRRSSFWELRPGATQGERRMLLPELCNGAYASIAARAPRAACISVDRRADVWTVDLPALMR
jgi:Tol biopolymer transport system component/tRNA A-37 threonylcarbamoyl transferase component Bud32